MAQNKTSFTGSAADRKVYFDYLRVLATFSVVILHLSAQYWIGPEVNSFDWQVFNFFDSIVRWSVPVFVMISGSLFLNRETSLRTIFHKYIRRMIIAFIVWSAIYSAFMDVPKISHVSAFLEGHYHMWFILMIIGLYMCIPFLNTIAESDSRTRYFLLLSFVFGFAFPEIITLIADFGNGLAMVASGAINKYLASMDMQMVLGYTSYFLLGYYLDKVELNRRQRIIIYILGLAGFVFTIVMDSIVALKTQTPCDHYYGNFTVNVLLEAVAVFTAFKYRKYHHDHINLIVQKMSKLCFGAYCVHALIIEQLNSRFGLNTLSFHPVFAILSLGGIVFAVSMLLSALLSRIPVVKKYIV